MSNKISFCGYIDEREIKQGADYVRVFRTAEIAKDNIPDVETLQRVQVKHMGYHWVPSKDEIAANRKEPIMCEIYNHKCDHKDCEVVINMHLGDYETDRKEIKVFCDKHIPSDLSHGIVERIYDGIKSKGWPRYIFVEPLTLNATQNWAMNHWNEAESKVARVFGRPVEGFEDS